MTHCNAHVPLWRLVDPWRDYQIFWCFWYYRWIHFAQLKLLPDEHKAGDHSNPFNLSSFHFPQLSLCGSLLLRGDNLLCRWFYLMFRCRFVPQLISTACSSPFLRSLLVEKLSSCLSLFIYKNLLFSLPRPFQLFLLDHLALLLGVSWFDDQQAAP